MILVQITSESHIKQAKTIISKIFQPEELHDVVQCYIDSATKNYTEKCLEYYLMYASGDQLWSGKPVGVTGLYSDSDDYVWVGWFGIAPEFRCNGYGKQLLEATFGLARQRKYKYAYLYTDPIINADACRLYEKFGMSYDPSRKGDKLMVYGIDLNNYGNPIPLWKGTPLGSE